jgi:hypothetical protein
MWTSKTITIFIIAVLLSLGTTSADEILIPWSCYPKQVQEAFAEQGMKLDLSGNDRTPESWGFLENKGMEFIIYSYKPMTKQDWENFNLIFYGR